jgi:hypothetical protein
MIFDASRATIRLEPRNNRATRRNKGKSWRKPCDQLSHPNDHLRGNREALWKRLAIRIPVKLERSSEIREATLGKLPTFQRKFCRMRLT